MKKIVFSFFVIFLTMIICGCSKNETTNKYMELSKNIKNEIEINIENITSEATYANYVESYKDKFKNWKGTVK